jgi:hypothetical protein
MSLVDLHPPDNVRLDKDAFMLAKQNSTPKCQNKGSCRLVTLRTLLWISSCSIPAILTMYVALTTRIVVSGRVGRYNNHSGYRSTAMVVVQARYK